ncbi:uncharacterized protein ARMOST_04503 [Armillaria ostoyae]|uniref:Uncharacterized protein n=1 Tax=Armillaria ostoyae TaxID=47428 RepID=A0A284QXP4_ARMOS|nr:uncharacterized protein ARMOST_04503 [Armillaria ostoyae]
MANIVPVFSEEMDQSFRPLSPVSTASVPLLSNRPSTPIPPRLIQEPPKEKPVHYLGQNLDTVVNPRTYTENIQNVGVNYVIIENLRRFRDGDQVREVDPQKIYLSEEEGKWDSCTSSSPSPEPLEPALIAEMPTGPATRSPLSPVPPTPSPPPHYHRDFEVPQIFVESPEPMSGYNSDSPTPSTPSSHSSLPSLRSYSDSDDSDDAYSPLSLDELTRGNMKSKYFAMEPVHLRKETKAALADLPNEPCQHADEWRPAHKFMPTDNGSISPHPFSLVDNQYIYQVLQTFSGPVDNSPLQHYKIATLALKIYDLITELDVHLDQWRETQPRISQAELKKIRITIFHAHTEHYRLEDTGDWGRYLIMQGVADMPASTRIIAKDSSEGEIAPTPWVIIFLKPGEMMPGKEHIAEAVRNQENLKTYKILDGDPPFTFLNVAIMEIPGVYLNPWHPILSHLHIIQIFIHRFLGLVCKQFLSQQWRQAIDRLSPEDDVRYYFVSWIQASPLTFKASITGACMLIVKLVVYAPLALLATRSLLRAKMNSFTMPHLFLNLKAVAHVLFEQGFIEPINYYDAEGRHRAFHGDELDLQYYDEVD